MSKVELYSFEACPFAQRTRMVLAEKAIAFELHEIDLADRPANWLEISPTGKVPVLRHEGVTIYESAIINQYLDESFDGPALMPATPAGRAQARIWMDYCDHQLLPAMHQLMWQRDDDTRIEANRKKARDSLVELETRGLSNNSGGPYWFGTEPSLVDFQYLPFFERLPVYQELAGLEWPAECEGLEHWLAAMKTRDSVRETLRPVDFHIEQQRLMLERIAARRSAA